MNGARQASAEIIAEAPSSQSVLPLADFGTVHFTGAAVNGRPAGDDNPIALTLVSGKGAAEATPSVLASTAFTVTWESSGTGAANTTGVGTPGTGTTGTTGTTGRGRRHHHRTQDQG